MATKTFAGIRSDIDGCAAMIAMALHREPVDVPAIERELARLKELSERIGVLIERLRETWG